MPPCCSGPKSVRRSGSAHLGGRHHCHRQVVLLVVSDGLDALPHMPCVSAVCEVSVDSLGVHTFCLSDGRDSLDLAVVRAALSPVLKAESRVFSSARTSAVMNDFWLKRVVMVCILQFANSPI